MTEFYIHQPPPTLPADARQASFEKPYWAEWTAPDTYLEEAIRTGASDEALAFLDSAIGRDFCMAMELHHQMHGKVLWGDCPARECAEDCERWNQLAALWSQARRLKALAS